MNHLSLPRSLLILHHHFFRLSRIRGERETSDRDSSSSRPSLTPHSDHSNWTQSRWFQNWTQSQNWTQFLGQWFQIGTKGWSVTVISNRNHTLTPPCQSLWQLFQSPDGTISNENNQQMKKGSGSDTPSQTHPSLVKICEEATRTWSDFHLWPSQDDQSDSVKIIFCGRDKSGSSCRSLFEFPRWLVPLLPDTVYLVTRWAAQLMWSKLVKS